MKYILKATIFSLLLTSCAPAQVPISYHQTYNEGVDLLQCESKQEKYESFEACENLSGDKNIYQWASAVVANNSKKIVLWFADGPNRKSSFSLFNQNQTPTAYSNFLSTLFYFNVDFYLLNQAQWMKIEKYNEIKSFTEEDIAKENDETITKANEVIKKLKEEKKDIILGGQGYGAYLLNLYLEKYGTQDLISAVSFAGRIKPNENVKKPFEEGCEFYYYGKNDEVVEKNSIPEGTGQESFCKFLRIGNGVFEDQRKRLANVNFANVTFVSGVNDKFSGWLSSLEQQWLKQRNAKVKVFDQNQIDSLYDEYGLEWNSKFISDLGDDPKTFSHFVGWANKALVKEYFITPFVEAEKKE